MRLVIVVFLFLDFALACFAMVAMLTTRRALRRPAEEVPL